MYAMLRETPRLASWIVLLLVLGAVSGLAFAGWIRFGADIFLTLAESGLNWCL